MAKNERQELRDIIFGDCLVIQNGCRLVVEGVLEIQFCSREKIILKAKRQITVEGEALNLSQLGNDNMEIEGKLIHLYFAEDGK